MRTLVYDRYGNPADVLRVAEVPEPEAPGPDEVLLRVVSRAIHPGDLIGIRGGYRTPGSAAGVATGGAVPGFEGYGLVEAVGSDVDPASGIIPGGRAAFFPARGAWGEKVIAVARFVVPIPDDVSDDAASQLFVKPMTAALLIRAAVAAGAGGDDDSLIVQSAAGSGVGRVVSALASRKGLSVINVVRSRRGAEKLAQQSPNMSVVATENEDWTEQIVTAAHGRPIRVVLDPVGGPIGSKLVSVLNNGGSLISYGDLSGEPISVPALAFSVRGIRISGVSVGNWAGLSEGLRRSDLDDALDLARSSAGLFGVEAHYRFDDISEALHHAERAGRRGPILLTS